jgi:hypothetical protein
MESYLLFNRAILTSCLLLLFQLTKWTDASIVKGASGSISHSGGDGQWSWNFLSITSPTDAGPFSYGVADRDPRDKEGERGVPARRYAHSSVMRGNEMIITHGYYYDMTSVSGSGATWLSDTWSLDVSTQQWRRLHGHVIHPSYGPVARYAAVATLVAGDLFLHGGDDGGNAERLPSYKHSIYGDMWRFILSDISVAAKPSRRMHSWERVHTVVSEFGVGMNIASSLSISVIEPRDDLYRAQHAGALALMDEDDWLVRNDMDESADTTDNQPPDSAVHNQDGDVNGKHVTSERTHSAPYWFITHGLSTAPSSTAPSSLSGMSNGAYDVLEHSSVWIFSFRSKRWRMIHTTSSDEGGAGPAPRFGHALIFVPATLRTTDASLSTNRKEHRGRRGASLFLYGGSTRSGVIQGDLWRLWLQEERFPSINQVYPSWEWHRVHASFSSDSGLSPAPRAYHSLSYSADGRVHLFGGARCEPGCVCSAEYWTLNIQATESNEYTTEGAPILTPWTLIAASPYSPSSRAYPLRTPSGTTALRTADDSIVTGWPLHRYKHTMLQLLPTEPSQTAGMHTFSFFIFGGESYNPAAYLQDTWRFDYTVSIQNDAEIEQGRAGITSHSLHSTYDIFTVMSMKPFSQLEFELPLNQQLAPHPFHIHQPSNGWGDIHPPPSTETPHLRVYDSNQPMIVDVMTVQVMLIALIGFIVTLTTTVIVLHRCLHSPAKEHKRI